MIGRLLSSCMRYVLNRPTLRNALGLVIRSFPWLNQTLFSFAVRAGIVGSKSVSPKGDLHAHWEGLLVESAMTPRAIQIYKDLSASLDKRHK